MRKKKKYDKLGLRRYRKSSYAIRKIRGKAKVVRTDYYQRKSGKKIKVKHYKNI